MFANLTRLMFSLPGLIVIMFSAVLVALAYLPSVLTVSTVLLAGYAFARMLAGPDVYQRIDDEQDLLDSQLAIIMQAGLWLWTSVASVSCLLLVGFGIDGVSTLSAGSLSLVCCLAVIILDLIEPLYTRVDVQQWQNAVNPTPNEEKDKDEGGPEEDLSGGVMYWLGTYKLTASFRLFLWYCHVAGYTATILYVVIVWITWLRM